MEAYLIFFVAGVGSEVGFIFLDKAKKVPGTRYKVPEYSKVKMRYSLAGGRYFRMSVLKKSVK